MDVLALISGFRFVDTFFPSGGYAFSSGLEAAVQGGAVRNAEDLFYYVEDLMRHGLAGRESVAANQACQAALVGHLDSALRVDCELDAMKLGAESRYASRQMGQQIAKIAAEKIERAMGHSDVVGEYLAEIDRDRTPGHAAVALGVTLGTCGWTREAAAAAFLYQVAVGFVSAGMKLLPLGQREGQRLLDRWTPLVVRVSRESISTKKMQSWSPVHDIYGMRHSRLEWKLFRS